jgi:hypothetical protein
MNRLGSIRAFASVDECEDRLHRAGWSMGELLTSAGWIVSGTNGENMIEARGRTQSEAWQRACEQARSVGMLASARD